ncbi:MAG: SDR family NAD(P)-dependent oxidoreductase [Bacteriovoracaceae bacterium]
MTNSKKVILITGTSRGLGKSLAQHYLSLGHFVFGCSRGESTIQSENYTHETLDLANEEAVRSWVSAARRKNKQIDVLICNAGLVQSTLFLSVTSGELLQKFLNSNILGAFFPIREASKYMALQKQGRIIVISSTMVPLHEKGTSIYSSTKSFLTQMTKVLANELAQSNVTCNIIAPGLMQTSSSEELAKNQEWQERMLGLQTIPRIIQDKEICHVADFYLSDLASAITGQVVYLGLVD